MGFGFEFTEGIGLELRQALEEGRAVPPELREQLERIGERDFSDPDVQRLAGELMDRVQQLPLRGDYPFVEPEGLEEIRAERPAERTLGVAPCTPEYDRILGAWLGRCVGCLLGNPIEGWRRERIVGFLKDTGNWPIQRYLSSDVSEEIRARYQVEDVRRVYSSNYLNWINHVSVMPEDDDTNYTALAMMLLSDYGWAFTSEDVAACWMQQLPLLHTYTAERASLRAFVYGVLPPRSAHFRNPMREWIGAMIRADFYGYITPGDPALGAELAWRDARISHTGNGIYGAMWVAAMLSAAAVEPDVAQVVRAGLGQIPGNCRLASAIREVLAWREEPGLSGEQALERIHQRYRDDVAHDAVHTISNAMIVAVALLWGEGTLARTVGLAVQGCLDTDCNGATAGSVCGLMLGAQHLPAQWIDPLGGKLRTRINALGEVSLSELAARTLRIANAKPR